MKSTYVGKQKLSIEYHKISCNSNVFIDGISKLDKVISRLDTREHVVFQRIVDSTKFGSHHECQILANELCTIKLLKTKLLLMKNFYEKVIQ